MRETKAAHDPSHPPYGSNAASSSVLFRRTASRQTIIDIDGAYSQHTRHRRQRKQRSNEKNGTIAKEVALNSHSKCREDIAAELND